MGYRFVLRRLAYPQAVRRNGQLKFETWWENKGVAPCYEQFPLAFRFKNKRESKIVPATVDIRKWLPGDNIYNDALGIPSDILPGEYTLQLALIDPLTEKPKVLLAIEGRDEEGWYTMGAIKIE